MHNVFGFAGGKQGETKNPRKINSYEFVVVISIKI